MLLDGTFDETTPIMDPTHLRWPSIACLDVAGNVQWSHCHHNRTRVAIGSGGSVATIGPVVEVGEREWEGIDSLVGV